ncbi:hypothetical protein [Peteryoungia ipomoeae]|uniref:Uncharacterized protein n=1 Tax=Peteryoungia ipomoeae TaxID=1210932 RepID=A0A4S8PBA5_9HYPH|nr:hypothetical protein [Peteryoungia ipomoeae]THV25424.1 hypothetical protein FAA97_04305 [Peteryoungia ipomoeae]
MRRKAGSAKASERSEGCAKTASLLLAAFSLALGLPATATSGPLLDAAMKAERLAAAGDAVAALDAIQAGMAAFSQALPLTIARAKFVTEKPAAYRSYREKPDPIFRRGEPLITYLEIVGLDWKDTGSGEMEAHFTVDMRLTDATGRDVALKQGFGDFRYAGQGMAQEVFTHLTLDVAGAAPGSYVLSYTLNDLVSERSVRVEQPFSIAGDS